MNNTISENLILYFHVISNAVLEELKQAVAQNSAVVKNLKSALKNKDKIIKQLNSKIEDLLMCEHHQQGRCMKHEVDCMYYS